MKKLGYLLVLALVFSCCGDDPEPIDTDGLFYNSQLKLRFTPTWNGVPVTDGSEYTDQFGNRLLQFNFKFFVSELKLVSEAGGELEVSPVELIEVGDGEVELTFPILQETNYTAFKMHTGVSPEYNVDYDPSTWPNDFPLSVQGAAGMHWSWNTGYIFTKFDGKADTTDTVEPSYLYPFSFHAGADEFYTLFEYDMEFYSEIDSTHDVHFQIEMEKFLDGVHQIDIRDDGETHTGGDFQLAQQFTDNFNASLQLVE